jgi:hypothetical protein
MIPPGIVELFFYLATRYTGLDGFEAEKSLKIDRDTDSLLSVSVTNGKLSFSISSQPYRFEDMPPESFGSDFSTLLIFLG